MTRAQKFSAQEMRRMAAKLEKAEAEVARLTQAIRRHHQQVVEHDNWGADDELWDVLRLHPRPETKAA